MHSAKPPTSHSDVKLPSIRSSMAKNSNDGGALGNGSRASSKGRTLQVNFAEFDLNSMSPEKQPAPKMGQSLKKKKRPSKMNSDLASEI